MPLSLIHICRVGLRGPQRQIEINSARDRHGYSPRATASAAARVRGTTAVGVGRARSPAVTPAATAASVTAAAIAASVTAAAVAPASVTAAAIAAAAEKSIEQPAARIAARITTSIAHKRKFLLCI